MKRNLSKLGNASNSFSRSYQGEDENFMEVTTPPSKSKGIKGFGKHKEKPAGFSQQRNEDLLFE
ncbi:hypothetical protein SS50377_24158 [Spironucleus salmonicida]|uniref:Uncharacterized protein n=1 Tax=Spironucleus salmonicida TaxID=348837 RepID=V6LWR9_9EUKA|nr:hypothetical protein SS50377_24158 [Spironucleus salmonicida]|eukprot:EST49035.1 Hypothetical protein SS50377_10733 [Spironucleus salmonicida]